MKRIIKLYSILILLSIIFFTCGKPADQFIGQWNVGYSLASSITFHENGTCTAHWYNGTNQEDKILQWHIEYYNGILNNYNGTLNNGNVLVMDVPFFFNADSIGYTTRWTISGEVYVYGKLNGFWAYCTQADDIYTYHDLWSFQRP